MLQPSVGVRKVIELPNIPVVEFDTSSSYSLCGVLMGATTSLHEPGVPEHTNLGHMVAVLVGHTNQKQDSEPQVMQECDDSAVGSLW